MMKCGEYSGRGAGKHGCRCLCQRRCVCVRPCPILPPVPATYSVVYLPNGGVGGMTDAGLFAGQSYSIKAPSEAGVSRPGYTFEGWNTQPDGGGIFYLPGEIITIEGDLTLYAQWTPDGMCYCVIYEANGGTGGAQDFDLTPGSQYTIRSAEDTGISRAGYIFIAWNTQPDGSGTFYDPGDVITVMGTIILYAQWVQEPADTYSVTYLPNGGTGGVVDTDLSRGSSYTIRSATAVGIEFPGYTFTGWNTQPNGSGASFIPGEVITIQTDLILYAQWTPVQTSIVLYLANGGSGDMVDSDIPTGSNYTVRSAQDVGISRPGYTFIGWNTMADGSGDAYAPGDVLVISGNVVLFAQWRPDVLG